jgi:hypothetical protein
MYRKVILVPNPEQGGARVPNNKQAGDQIVAIFDAHEEPRRCFRDVQQPPTQP